MRLSVIRAGVLATAAAIVLAACAGRGVVPSSPSALDQSGPRSGPAPLAVATCAKSPPQYEWIFKGACVRIALKPTGANFKLQEYDNITITGSIGKNSVKGSATVDLADATGNGDVLKYKGESFPKYKAKGTTFIYAVAINQSSQVIKPIAEKNKPILEYVITDAKGLPGKTCGAAVLTTGQKGSLEWAALPGQYAAKGNTVTITQYNVPSGFELAPKAPLYFGVNCFS